MRMVRLDDGFPDHPKVLAAGVAAGWLYICGLAYCSRHRTDGYIPQGRVARLADVAEAVTLAGVLVQVGLWEVADGGYRVHDYLDYQPAKADIEEVHVKRAAAGRKGGLQRGMNWREANEANAKQSAKQNRSKTEANAKQSASNGACRWEAVVGAEKFAQAARRFEAVNVQLRPDWLRETLCRIEGQGGGLAGPAMTKALTRALADLQDAFGRDEGGIKHPRAFATTRIEAAFREARGKDETP